MNVRQQLGLPKTKGEVGIEIEIEANNVGMIRVPGWDVVGDGSLRGDGAEFVLKQPVARNVVHSNLKRWKKCIGQLNVKDSGRAGIHVHINVQELTQRELWQFVTMYLIFEKVLIRWCGDQRMGNLFCLSATDAPQVLHQMRRSIKEQSLPHLGTDGIRYSSVNLKAVTTYGSVEFRAMRSTDDIKEIQTWVDILLHLKDESIKYESPADVVERLSHESILGFFKRIFKGTPFVFDKGDILEGVRNAQYVAYARTDWAEEEEEEDDIQAMLEEHRQVMDQEEDEVEEWDAPPEEAPHPQVNIKPAPPFNRGVFRDADDAQQFADAAFGRFGWKPAQQPAKIHMARVEDGNIAYAWKGEAHLADAAYLESLDHKPFNLRSPLEKRLIESYKDLKEGEL